MYRVAHNEQRLAMSRQSEQIQPSISAFFKPRQSQESKLPSPPIVSTDSTQYDDYNIDVDMIDSAATQEIPYAGVTQEPHKASVPSVSAFFSPKRDDISKAMPQVKRPVRKPPPALDRFRRTTQDSEGTSQVDKATHDKFVRKFIGQESVFSQGLKRKRGQTEADGYVGDGTFAGQRSPSVPPPDEDSDEAIARRLQAEFAAEKPKQKRKTSDPGSKLTPLEKQVVEIKEKHPDTLLIVEVGYKFKFFGEDARTASQVLNIVSYMDHNFYVASVPVHRLNVHVKRLLNAGHKVGVVRQIETAALKKIGDNRNNPFVRELTELYTKATFVDDINSLDDENSLSTIPTANYLLCLIEDPKATESDKDGKIQFGMVAVQVSTGDIIYDQFEDGYMRSELETRLLHLQPTEIIIPSKMSKATEKLLGHLSRNTTTALGDRVRLERMEAPSHATCYSEVSTFYADKARDNEPASQEGKLLASVLELPEKVITALALLIRHLTQFKLEHIFDLTKFFQPFLARSHMLLNANTLANLEIYRNQTDYKERGSLFWVLDHTKTAFGKRLLRKWVGRPLVDVEQLRARAKAVDEVLNSRNIKLDKVREVLKGLPDLEKGLCRIHYGKCQPSELYQIITAMHRVANVFPAATSTKEYGITSELIQKTLDVLPTIQDDTIYFLSSLNATAAQQNDKVNLFRDVEKYPAIQDRKDCIAMAQSELTEHLKAVRKKMRMPRLDYATVAGVEFLLEIPAVDAKKVPDNWIKISSTKAYGRYHSPEIIRMTKERDQQTELLNIECQSAYCGFLGEIAERYDTFREVIQRLAVIDCLFSLATVACQPGYVCPEYVEYAEIKVDQARHPMVEQLSKEQFVPNDISLDADALSTMVLTGPNMGGKSSYIRTVALICIMGHIGSYVPAARARLGMLDAVFTRMGAFDNMIAGESTFMVELHETSDIMKAATSRSLVVLDEVGRGSSTNDGMAIAFAVLRYFIEHVKSITLFVTHYPLLGIFADEFPQRVGNYHMGFLQDADMKTVTFLYKLTHGLASRSYGLNVARLAELPEGVLAKAHEKSAEMEKGYNERKEGAVEGKMQRALQQFHRVAASDGEGDQDGDITGIFDELRTTMALQGM